MSSQPHIVMLERSTARGSLNGVNCRGPDRQVPSPEVPGHPPGAERTRNKHMSARGPVGVSYLQQHIRLLPFSRKTNKRCYYPQTYRHNMRTYRQQQLGAVDALAVFSPRCLGDLHLCWLRQQRPVPMPEDGRGPRQARRLRRLRCPFAQERCQALLRCTAEHLRSSKPHLNAQRDFRGRALAPMRPYRGTVLRATWSAAAAPPHALAAPGQGGGQWAKVGTCNLRTRKVCASRGAPCASAPATLRERENPCPRALQDSSSASHAPWPLQSPLRCSAGGHFQWRHPCAASLSPSLTLPPASGPPWALHSIDVASVASSPCYY